MTTDTPVPSPIHSPVITGNSATDSNAAIPLTTAIPTTTIAATAAPVTPTAPVIATTTQAATQAAQELELIQRQVATGLLEGNGGLFALCLNKDSSDYGNILFKHEGLDAWKKQRIATPAEMALGETTLIALKAKLGV